MSIELSQFAEGDDIETGNVHIDGLLTCIGAAADHLATVLALVHEGEMRRARRHMLNMEVWVLDAEDWSERLIRATAQCGRTAPREVA